MLALTPTGAELELHVNLLRHGRRTCHARAPSCERCALARMCPSARVLGRVAQARGSTAKAITA
jgi:endonuclease III